MEKIIGEYSDYTYALMRIIVGALFFCHGAQKIFGWFGGADGKGGAAMLASLMGAAGVLELVLGALIVLGLWAGYAAFVASGEMAAAYFIGHFPMGFWPLENNGEAAVIYCFVFLYIATRGAGVLSIDDALT